MFVYVGFVYIFVDTANFFPHTVSILMEGTKWNMAGRD
jgi:hypothetical protein